MKRTLRQKSGKQYAESKNILGPWSVDGIVEDAITVKDGLILKGGRIKEVIQTAYEEVTEQDSDRIVQTVASGDVVVLALGEPELWSGEAGSRSVIELPEHQISLLKKLHEHQIPVVVLLFNGRPLDLRKVKEYADAVLEMWFPGTEGGNAAAALLYGEKNFHMEAVRSLCPMIWLRQDAQKPIWCRNHDINHSIWIYRMNHCIHLDMA